MSYDQYQPDKVEVKLNRQARAELKQFRGREQLKFKVEQYRNVDPNQLVKQYDMTENDSE